MLKKTEHTIFTYSFRLLALVLLLSFSQLACGGKGSQSSSDKFSSPKELINFLKGKKKDDFASLYPVIAPDERPLVAFTLDFMTSFMLAFSKDQKIKDQYESIQKKYKLNELGKDDSFKTSDLKDTDKLMALAQKRYGSIDIKSFVHDLQTISNSIPGQKSQQIKHQTRMKEIKDLKIDGDKATGEVLLDNGKTEKFVFKKVDGGWYLSIKDMMKK